MKQTLNIAYWIVWVLSIIGMFALIHDIFTAQTYSQVASLGFTVFFAVAPIVVGLLYEKS